MVSWLNHAHLLCFCRCGRQCKRWRLHKQTKTQRKIIIGTVYTNVQHWFVLCVCVCASRKIQRHSSGYKKEASLTIWSSLMGDIWFHFKTVSTGTDSADECRWCVRFSSDIKASFRRLRWQTADDSRKEYSWYGKCALISGKTDVRQRLNLTLYGRQLPLTHWHPFSKKKGAV